MKSLVCVVALAVLCAVTGAVLAAAVWAAYVLKPHTR